YRREPRHMYIEWEPPSGQFLAAMTEPVANHHHASFPSQGGFTFIEVIIAVIMVAFVGGVLLSILSGSRRSTTETRAQVARQVTLRSINEVIEIDLEKVSFSATAP